jgi:hypothetical protein
LRDRLNQRKAKKEKGERRKAKKEKGERKKKKLVYRTDKLYNFQDEIKRIKVPSLYFSYLLFYVLAFCQTSIE